MTFSFASLPQQSALAQGAAAKTVSLEQVDAFLAIGADGDVTCYSGKVDLGTGVRTAIAQIVADELDVPFGKVAVVQGDTALTPDQGPTYGSLSIQVGGMQVRQAAATARAALVREAAKRLDLAEETLVTQDGAVVAQAASQRITYGALVGGKAFELKLDPKAPLKDPATYRVVGQSVPRLDIPAKVTGEFTYMQDFAVPGMLHARVIRPAGMRADLLSYDDSAAKQIKGFVQTVGRAIFLRWWRRPSGRRFGPAVQ